jgi:1-phosphofructokinase family hexose kinase
MIAVAGFNTSIDKLLLLDDLVPGSVVRARDAQAWPGGKGVHVALAAAVLGEKVRLCGLIDRTQHDWFASWLRDRAVEFHGIEFSGPVRTCLTIHDRRGRTTEIREPGPAIDDTVWERTVSGFKRACVEARVAVLSGSVPPGAPQSAYRAMVADLSPLPVLVDAAGDLLRLAIRARPFCVKPNREEADALTRIPLGSTTDAVRAARALAERGVQLVIISLGEKGAVACWENRVCQLTPPSVRAINVVGAGDCLLAGVAVGLARGHGMDDVLRLGVACGTAKVLSPEIGIIRRADVEVVLPQVRISWLR